MQNFIEWIKTGRFSLLSEAKVRYINEQILQTIQFLIDGNWKEEGTRESLDKIKKIVYISGEGVKSPEDSFRLTVLYTINDGIEDYDPKVGSSSLSFNVTLLGWKPDAKNGIPISIKNKNNQPFYTIQDKKTGEISNSQFLKTPYEIASWIKKWIEIFYEQDNDGGSGGWDDELDPTDPRELVPVLAPKLKR